MLNCLPADVGNVPGIYIIRNSVNPKVYIGSSVRLRNRYRHHANALATGKHVCRSLTHFVGKYGTTTLSFHLLELCAPSDLLSRENELILAHQSNKPAGGFNLRLQAFTNLGIRHDAEARANMSESSLGKAKSLSHRESIRLSKMGNKSRLGRQNSEAHNAALREAQLARPPGSQRGRVLSAEHRQKLSDAARGKPKSQAHKAALSLAQKGVTRSADSIAKSAASRIGLTLSPESIAKRTASRKRNQEGQT